MLGYSRKEFIGRHLWEIGAFRDTARSKEAFQELQKKKYIRYENLPLETKNGQPFAVEFISNVYWVNHKKVIQCNIRDMTERENLRRNLQELATHDTLTGLPNRILLYDRFEVAKASANRRKKKLALMSIDMDNFKTVNDTLGHDIGDKLLVKVAQRLTQRLRKSDTIARIGGDEFILLLWEIDGTGDADKIAQKVLEDFREPFIIERRRLMATLSLGIAFYPDDGKDIKPLLLKSDRALYRAKAAGRDTYRFSGS
jgi:diguanylate cyclase (GGDEF)-like protein